MNIKKRIDRISACGFMHLHITAFHAAVSFFCPMLCTAKPCEKHIGFIATIWVSTSYFILLDTVFYIVLMSDLRTAYIKVIYLPNKLLGGSDEDKVVFNTWEASKYMTWFLETRYQFLPCKLLQFSQCLSRSFGVVVIVAQETGEYTVCLPELKTSSLV